MAQQPQRQFSYQKDNDIETRKDLNEQLPEESDKENQERSLDENQHLPEVTETKHKTYEIWESAPCRMLRGSAAMYGSVTYFGLPDSRKVLSYNSDTNMWSSLPECPRVNFTLAVVNDLVTAVGGKKDARRTNTLISLKEKSRTLMWVEHFPPMPTKRKFPAVVCSENVLVVTGGVGKKKTTLETVEVMDTDTLHWSTASNLPQPLSDATATVCGDRLYLVGGKDQDGYYTNLVLSCSLGALLQSQTVEARKMKTLSLARKRMTLSWDMIAALPVTRSTCVTVNGQLLAVGGCESDGNESNNIYSYNTKHNSWEVISQIPTARCQCLVAVLPNNELMVVGGIIENYITDKVEIATLQEKNQAKGKSSQFV